MRFNGNGEIKTSRIGLWHKDTESTEEKVGAGGGGEGAGAQAAARLNSPRLQVFAMLELREECEATKLSPKPFPYTFAYV